MIQLPGLLSLGIARPALRLGGEWAGWFCAFNAQTGKIITSDVEKYCSDTMIEWGQIPFGFEECTTETWQGNTLERRSIRLLPEDGCNTENLAAIVTRKSLPAATSGTLTLSPGAAQLDAAVLNVRAWALDAADDASGWYCETIFDGVGGEHPRVSSGAIECPAERTRVRCAFDPATGELAGREPVMVWQERCWSARPSEDFEVREGSGMRSGIDASWLSSVVGMSCFGAQKQPPAQDAGEERDAAAASSSSSPPPVLVALAGGVELRGAPGILEVALASEPGEAYWSELRLRRTWAGGSCFIETEVANDASDKMRRGD
jgi:hypothetical protein